MSDYFKNSIDHIMAELGLIELKLDSKLRSIQRDDRTSTNNQIQGLYVSEKEIDSIVNIASYMKEEKVSSSQEPEPVQLVDSLVQLKNSISAKKKESLRRGITLKLGILEELFQLSAFDIDVLLLCLLPEINLMI